LTEPTPPQEAARSRLAEKLPWLTVAAAVLAADLWTKHLVFYPAVLDPRFDAERPPVVGKVLGLSWWQTVLAYNRGVTFGIGADAGAWVLSLGTGLVIAVLLRTLWRTPAAERLKVFALSIIVGGAVGNLYDRALRPHVEADKNQGVRDFLDWYVPEGSGLANWLRAHNVQNHWYTFNVADALIVSGVCLLAWKILREKEPPEAKVAPAEGAA
jgi:signal peptidase II